MIYQFLIFVLFVNVVLSLQCNKAWPANCEYNSTCSYTIKECSSSTSSIVRGGVYCTTLISGLDNIIVGNMDCMYDQETSKTCKNQSECVMKYTSKEKHFLHCCCDKDFCNINFTLSNPFEIETFILSNNSDVLIEGNCLGSLFCKPIYLLILFLIIGLFILFLILICFLNRKRILKSRLKICRLLGIPMKSEQNTIQEPLNINEHQEEIVYSKNFEINLNDLIIEKNSFKQGRFSRIYKGELNGEKVAIKILSENNQRDEARLLFNNEKQIYSLTSIQHENILKFIGYLINGDCYYIITELSSNGSLRDVLRSRLLEDEIELVSMCQQISSGVEYLHHDSRSRTNLRLNVRPPIAHRDLKSDNILVSNNNRLVICDFAMSIILDENKISPNEQQQIGTPRYMSPEILAGTIGNEANALLKSDIYALALIFWELLSRCNNCDPNEIYSMPYENELLLKGLNKSPGINEMLQIINPLHRPIIRSDWKKLNHSNLNIIIHTIEECWDQNPEVRISAALVAHRMRNL